MHRELEEMVQAVRDLDAKLRGHGESMKVGGAIREEE